MARDVSAVAVGTIAAGGLLVWSGLKGSSVLGAAQDLIQGKKPAGTNVYPIGTPADAAAAVPTGANSAVGAVNVDGAQVAAWIAEVILCARSKGWGGKATSGYRSTKEQAEVCATGVQPCAAPGTSHHQGIVFPDGAVDVTNAAQLSMILSSGQCNGRGLVWAGDKDPVHFSIPGVHRPGEMSW